MFSCFFFHRSVKKMHGVLVACFLLCIGAVCSQVARPLPDRQYPVDPIRPWPLPVQDPDRKYPNSYYADRNYPYSYPERHSTKMFIGEQ